MTCSVQNQYTKFMSIVRRVTNTDYIRLISSMIGPDEISKELFQREQ